MMKNILLLTLLSSCFLLSDPAYGQKKSESKSVYSDMKKKASRSSINTLLLDAEKRKSEEPQMALESVKEALAMSIAEHNLEAEAHCYNLMGEINLSISEYKLALENFSTAIEKQSEIKIVDESSQVKSLQGIGLANLKLGNHKAALEYFQR